MGKLDSEMLFPCQNAYTNSLCIIYEYIYTYLLFLVRDFKCKSKKIKSIYKKCFTYSNIFVTNLN